MHKKHKCISIFIHAYIKRELFQVIVKLAILKSAEQACRMETLRQEQMPRS